MGQARTLASASVRLVAWSLFHEPWELGSATHFQVTATFAQNPQYGITGDNMPYELIDGLFGGHGAMNTLVLPKERLYALGWKDPSDLVHSTLDVLFDRLVGHAGINLMVYDKLTGKRIVTMQGVKMSSVSLTVTSRAVLARQIQFVIERLPRMVDEFDNKFFLTDLI